MVIRALTGGVPARWVAGDEVYGAHTNAPSVIEDQNEPGQYFNTDLHFSVSKRLSQKILI